MLDVLGFQVKAGLVDLETIYELNWAPVLMTWMKFKPIIEEYKKTDYGSDSYANFEYLVREIWRARGTTKVKLLAPKPYIKRPNYAKTTIIKYHNVRKRPKTSQIV
jgi:hypothetical protein